jgi:cytochrome c oxidase subunit 3
MTTTVANVAEPTDLLPPGRIAMWLVIASDLMFFVGLVGAFIVLRAGNPVLFADHARELQRGSGVVESVALLISSAMMFAAVRARRNGQIKKSAWALLATVLCAGGFIALRSIEYADLLNHHTIVARENDSDPLLVFDGQIDWWNGYAPSQRYIDGYAAPVPADFDPHVVSEKGIEMLSPRGAREATEFPVPAKVFEDVRYGPGKNIFYAGWFTLTGAHLVHVVAGVIAIGVLLVQMGRDRASPIQMECVGLYWHFMVLVGVCLFPLLYLR